eukprot:TRINITY_DN425_c1_g1_i3.p1 TRINITY_DN425_c1_g1~~TRINITY_DN425_c1_g1_i3.p1  ORF type:complete len:2075 (+),score=297.05 TRINITY_DN425_c1_g1_i3:58-6282(+)
MPSLSRAFGVPLAALACASAADPGDLQYYFPNTVTQPFTRLCGEVSASFTPGRECTCDSTLKGIHIEVVVAGTDACAAGDKLTFGSATGVQVESSKDCMVVFEGKATLTTYLQLIVDTRFSTTATDGDARLFKYWLGHGWYNKQTGHYYGVHDDEEVMAYNPSYWSYVEMGDNSKKWRARSWLAGQYYCSHPDNDMLGTTGYLAVISDEDEYKFLVDSPNDVVWRGSIGGSDFESEGHWAWVTGPEGCPTEYEQPWVTPTERANGDVTDVLKRSMCPFGNLFSNPYDGDPTGARVCSDESKCCTMDQRPSYENGPVTQCSTGPLMGTRFLDAPASGSDSGGDPHQPGQFSVWGVKNGKDMPDHDGVGRDWLRTEFRGTDPLYYNDAQFYQPGASVFICEWGGVNDMCVPDYEMNFNVTFVHNVDECAEQCETCEEGATCPAGQDCVDPSPKTAVHLSNWYCECKGGVHGEGQSVGPQAAKCEVDECQYGGGTVCATANQGCDDTNKTTMGTWICTCPAGTDLLPGSVYSDALADCIKNECTASSCPAGQLCQDYDLDYQALGTFLCFCEYDPSVNQMVTPSAPPGALACPTEDDRDECKTVSTAAGSMSHIPRYTLAGCLCQSTWVLSGYDGPLPGSRGNACTSGCCNPDSDTHGDYCFVNETDAFNMAKAECSDPGLWGYCLPAGMLPATGGVDVVDFYADVTASISGVSDDYSNKCRHGNQLCVDTPGLDNWGCQCVPAQTADPNTAPDADRLVTCILDECVTEGAAFCSGQVPEQDCVDKDTDPLELRNWVCVCKVGTPDESLPTKAATCTMNECTEPTGHGLCPSCVSRDAAGLDFCAQHGQVCKDANESATSIRDWRCHCADPMTNVTGAAPTDPMKLAACELNECMMNGEANRNTCDGFGQDCVDTDRGLGDDGDWRCVCRAPYAANEGPIGGNPTPEATCTIDECEGTCGHCEGGACGKGQACVEPDTAVQWDWYCECNVTDGYNGTDGVAKADSGTDGTWVADCTRDECALDAALEKCRGQGCEDRDFRADGTWYCLCGDQETPDPVGAEFHMTTAICTMQGECVANGHICVQAGQHCHDGPNPDDWECQCNGDGETAVGNDHRPSTCEVNECITNCTSCEGYVGGERYCAHHGQKCRDDNVTETSSWYCECTGLASGTGTTQGAKTLSTGCEWDECDDPTGAPALECDNQKCVDDDKGRIGGWFCECPGGDRNEGNKVQVCTANDCDTEVCPAGQYCEDRNQTVPGEWYCVCNPADLLPGAPNAEAKEGDAECNVYNECNAVCASGCPASDATGDVCSKQAPPQTCVDLNETEHGSWMCQCAYSTVTLGGNPVPLGDCPLNECNVTCPGCADEGAGHKCSSVGQGCIDNEPNMGKRGDWECHCPSPLEFLSAPNASVTSCEFNECTETRPNEAAPAGATACGTQACFDTKPATTGSFLCVCNGPGETGEQPDGAATCDVDECKVSGREAMCANATGYDGNPQECFDPTNATGDWYCACPSPAHQRGQSPNTYSCTHSECNEAAKSQVCGADQDCADTDLTTDNTWECRCRTDSRTTRQPGKPANCKVNECNNATNSNKCLSDQECKDDDELSDGNWVCKCTTGTGADGQQGAATCVLPPQGDCELAGDAACIIHEQYCYDPEPAVDGSAWECRCYVKDPTVTVRAGGRPANCLMDECNVTANSAQCTAGQRCVDDNAKEDGNWQCVCVGTSGTPGDQTAAQCTGDCAAQAHGLDCGDGQACLDTDTNTADTWGCMCMDGLTFKPDGPATCPAQPVTEQDECDIPEHAAKCTSQHPPQKCVDHWPESLGDWRCYCLAADGQSGSFQKAGYATTCEYYGDCVVHKAKCEAYNQRCFDPTPNDLNGDWRCECDNNCVNDDECAVADCSVQSQCPFSICDDAGLFCLDTEAGPGNWECHCRVGSDGAPAASPGMRQCIMSTPVIDDDCSFWECYWWVLLLLLLCCCCLLLLLLLFLRRRQSHAEQQDNKWNSQFEGPRPEELDDIGIDGDEGESAAGRSSYKGGCTDGHASLLSWEARETPRVSSPLGSPRDPTVSPAVSPRAREQDAL